MFILLCRLQFVGKFIIGYVPTCGVKEYYIGSACEELYAPPSAYVGLYGFLVQASFLSGESVTLGNINGLMGFGIYSCSQVESQPIKLMFGFELVLSPINIISVPPRNLVMIDDFIAT